MENNSSMLHANRYPGSHSFRDNSLDRKLFKGRDKERKNLLHLILSEKLVVLYSKSGIGKSSLLNAGIYKDLRKRDYFPISFRLNDASKNANELIFNELEKVANDNSIEYVSGNKSSLWQYFISTVFWSEEGAKLTPVLVFDQFEEIFTLDYSEEQRHDFILQLASLVRGYIPDSVKKELNEFELSYYSDAVLDLKIILSLRDDFLPLLEDLSRDIPTILNIRFRLLPLTPEQARDAIVQPAILESEELVTEKFVYSDSAVDAILNFLGKKKIGTEIRNSKEIEPFQLQLLCQYVEQNILAKKKNTGSEVITIQEKDLGGEVGMEKILSDFYNNQLKKVPPQKRKAVRKLCEKKLISHNGRRLSIEEDTIVRNSKLSKELLDQLIKQRLIRSEPRLGSKYYELSHDTLVKPILESKKRNSRKRLKRIIFTPLIIFFLFFIGLMFTVKEEVLISSYSNELTKAYDLEDEGKYKEAINIYKGSLKEYPEYKEDTYLSIAYNYFTVNEYDSALRYYMIRVKEPVDIFYINEAGAVLQYKGRFNEALEYYKGSLQSSMKIKNSVSLKNRKAQSVNETSIEVSRIDELINSTDSLKREIENKLLTIKAEALPYLQTIEQNPNDANSYLQLAKFYNNYRYFEPAKYNYKEALKLQADNSAIYYNLSDLFISLELLDSAEYYLEKGIVFDDSFVRSVGLYTDLAFYYSLRDKNNLAVEKQKKAIDLYKKGEKINPELEYNLNIARTYGNLAGYQIRDSKFEEAIKSAEISWKMDPTLKWTYGHCAAGYLLTGQQELAVKYYSAYMNDNWGSSTYGEEFLLDIQEYEDLGIINENTKGITEIKEMLQETVPPKTNSYLY